MPFVARRYPTSLAVGLLLSTCVAAEERAAPEHAAPAPAHVAAAAPTAAVAEKTPAPAAAKPAPSAPEAGQSAPAPAAERRIQRAAPVPPRTKVNPPRVARASALDQGSKVPGTEKAATTPQGVAPTLAAASPEPHKAHWSYEGETGPEAWAKLAPEFAACANGARQSPIDIRDGMRVELEPIAFDYRPSSFRVIDNGHTIQANVGGWNSIRLMGRRYTLLQFHFHRPSEEMIDGKSYDMVVHLVHKDNEGRLAVVAVLIERGARQPVLQTVLNNLPLEKGEEIAAASSIDLNQLLPDNRKYFTYMGSLTTPPCTEGVLWIVMKQPVQANPDQLNLFARLYPMNARPIQSASGRTIKESN